MTQEEINQIIEGLKTYISSFITVSGTEGEEKLLTSSSVL